MPVLTDEVDDISSPVIDNAINEEIVGSPDDGDIVVDEDQRIMDSLLHNLGTFSYPVNKGVEAQLKDLAMTDERCTATRKKLIPDLSFVALRDSIEDVLQRLKDRHLFGG